MPALTESGKAKIDKIIDKNLQGLDGKKELDSSSIVDYVMKIRNKGLIALNKMSFSCDTKETIDYFTEILYQKLEELGFRDALNEILNNSDPSGAVSDYESLYGPSAL